MTKRKPNIVGGGAQTNVHGLTFEARADFRDAIYRHPHYRMEGNRVMKDDKVVATYYEKYGLYSDLLVPKGIDYKTVFSKKLLPVGALLVGDTLYIIEKKYQAGSGSVDEKLQTCDFKKKQYQKLLAPLRIKVNYYYVLNNWFNKPEYRDVFNYIESVGFKYFIEYIPLNEIGL